MSALALAAGLLLSGPAGAETPVRDISPRITRPVRPGDWTPSPAAIAPQPKPEAPAPAAAKIRLLRDGSVEVDGSKLRLRGIAMPEPGLICSADGTRWACGRAAFVWWMAVFREAVRCDIQEHEAVCFSGETDLNRSLVENGWARASSTENVELQSLASAARTKKIGIYGSQRP